MKRLWFPKKHAGSHAAPLGMRPQSQMSRTQSPLARSPLVLRPLILLVLILAILCMLFLSGCAGADEAIQSIEQLKEPGRVIAFSDGTPEAALIRTDFPKAEIQPFSDMVAAYTAVKNEKADACFYSRRAMATAIANGFDGVRLLDETYMEDIVAVGISKVTPIPDLKGKINTFLEELRQDGTLDDMYQRWVIDLDETMPDIPEPENPGGTIRVGTTGTLMPYSYYVGDQLAGYDIELATRFAAWLGMDLEFGIYSFGGIFAAAQSGEIDCIMSDLYYTEEHEEALDFSDPLFVEEVTVMVRDTGADAAGSAGGSFWNSIASSFEKTFIREGRWKLLVNGAGVTLLITVLSVVLGTMLGFAVYLLCRRGNRAANAVTRHFIRLVQGMPVVVFLMILYYVIFGKVNLSNVSVSVIGFTLIFGSTVFSMLKTSIEALDNTQIETSYALGFSDRQTFSFIILPQALPHIGQPFTEQLVALLKATAIVGYIAVQDLTKMGDIIRSRTYEAFFPLITIAVMYFILAWILIALVRGISKGIFTIWRRKRSLLKGVELHD